MKNLSRFYFSIHSNLQLFGVIAHRNGEARVVAVGGRVSEQKALLALMVSSSLFSHSGELDFGTLEPSHPRQSHNHKPITIKDIILIQNNTTIYNELYGQS